ncbi:alpha/beta fold hydrolase [Sphingosinicella sp. CPCC 101087]|uniref:alpha/beta fold hydrolase n=1 Tax=Sphingosinicella sp. CPCC 101087 TaxID=2497754 RepID=UPI001FB15D6F|nr:alpha/beta hydrolase [Sphingosinicella sp. CPCC 101087]
MANISEPRDTRPPPAWMLLRECAALMARFYRAFGAMGERGPADGPKLMVIPGFLATDRTTLGLQRALAEAGYRVTGWGLDLNSGARADTIERIVERLERFGAGEPVILVGWSLGGIYAREVAKTRPDLVAKVVTMGSPFSGNRRANNVWRLYELVAGHPVDDPPIATVLEEKPPVPTLALWSRQDGIVAVDCARGEAGERDHHVELDCSHMGFAVSARAFPGIVEAIRSFAPPSSHEEERAA